MVRGSDDDSKSSGSKPEYDGTIKPWAAARIAIKSFLHVNGKLQVVQHGVATESNIGTALEERLSPTNGAELGELLPHQTTTPDGGSAQWKIMIQDESTMRTGRDGTQVIGPLKSADIIDMIEDGTPCRSLRGKSDNKDPGQLRRDGAQEASIRRGNLAREAQERC